MADINTIINTCYQTTIDSRVIANYSHIIPIALSVILGIFVFIKAKFDLFAKVFLAFLFAFAIWLGGDLVTWTSNNYGFIYASWAPLVYIEILFFTLAFYFCVVFVRKKDISTLQKFGLFLLTIVPFIITMNGQSVLGFDQAVCEAINNEFLDLYKLVYEIILLLAILGMIVWPFIKKIPDKKRKRNILILLGSIFLFLGTFAITEYLASVTGFYEMNLYSLFILPLFLLTIIYAVFEFDVFHFHLLSTHYLVLAIIVLMFGQLLFIESTTDRLLTIITILLTIVVSFLMFRNFKRESDQRLYITELSKKLEDSNKKLGQANDKLKDLDRLKTEFLSLASHQLRSPLTAIKGYASMVIEGDFGKTTKKVNEAVSRIFQSSNNLQIIVEDLLNVSKIEQGGMKFEMTDFDFAEVVKNVTTDLSVNAKTKGLELKYLTDEKKTFMVNGDKSKLRQVVLNFTDNAIKYTKEGCIDTKIEAQGDKMLFSVKDTGMGLTPEIISTLFQKFNRGDGARMNTSGSGLGLYLAKEIVKAHGGRVWVESPGPGKGSTFFVELDLVK